MQGASGCRAGVRHPPASGSSPVAPVLAGTPVRSVPYLGPKAALSHEVISACDAVLIMTDHDSIDYQLPGKSAEIVIDTRNACARAGVAGSNVVKA